MTDISTFATSQLSLLDKELQAELAETQLLTATHAPNTLQREGLALLNLHVSSQRTGLGGKIVLELSLDPAVGGGGLPEHGLRAGDICAVAEQPKGAERKKEREGMEKQGVEGVVTRVHKESVTVALDRDEVEIPNGKLWLYVQDRIDTVSEVCRLMIYTRMQSQTSQRRNMETSQFHHDPAAKDAAFRAQHPHPSSLRSILSYPHSCR